MMTGVDPVGEPWGDSTESSAESGMEWGVKLFDETEAAKPDPLKRAAVLVPVKVAQHPQGLTVTMAPGGAEECSRRGSNKRMGTTCGVWRCMLWALLGPLDRRDSGIPYAFALIYPLRSGSS